MAITLILLAVATAWVALIAGFLLAFGLVVMPGFARLSDAAFVRAFQAVDGVIQDGEPRFGVLWLGSVMALAAATVAGFFVLPPVDRLLLSAAAALYLLGVQVVTGVIHLPLNRGLHQVHADPLTPAELNAARLAFEPTWNRWNRVRTAAALATVAVLIVVLSRH